MFQLSKETDERRAAKQLASSAAQKLSAPCEFWLLHGSVGSSADWRAVGRDFSENGISTVSVDLWKFLQEGSKSLAETADEINQQAADSNFNGRRILVGYSMGGRIALQAVIDGGPWHAAILISANPGLRDLAEAEKRRAADAQWAARAMSSPWQAFYDEWNSQGILGGEMRDQSISDAMANSRSAIARSFIDWSLGAQKNLWDEISEIEIPVLWMAGERDEKFLKIAERAALLNTQHQLATCATAGHRVPWEAQDWFVKTACEFAVAAEKSLG